MQFKDLFVNFSHVTWKGGILDHFIAVYFITTKINYQNKEAWGFGVILGKKGLLRDELVARKSCKKREV